jgi:hypothetical protein
MTGALSLAAVGWVSEHPTGNRLRWSWPEAAVDAGKHILPAKILVERAPLDVRYDPRAISLFGPAATVPASMWKQLGDVTLFGFTPVSQLLGGSVQAVRFLYKGFPALVQAFDGERCVATRSVLDGQMIVLHAPAMDLLTITAPFCELRMLATLDLYAAPPLSFKVIAEIGVAATGTASFGDARTRYPSASTLDTARWQELQALWQAAWDEAPGATGSEGAPNAWQELQIVLGTRWEHAVLCGLGFVDGPDNDQSALDHWTQLLATPHASAYRVRDASGTLDPSNIVCVPGGLAPDLKAVPAPSVENGAVRLGKSGTIHASWDLAWASPDPEIVGVEVEETLVVGGTSSTERYDARGRRSSDPPGAGFVHREEQVHSHIVSVAARLRAQDGFDRVGPWGATAPLTALPIDHYPQPPPLRSATNDGATALLHQAPPADWEPDALVAAAGGTIRIYRRIGARARFSAPVLQVIPTSDVLAIKLDGAAPPNTAAFVGARITIGPLKGTVSSLSWPVAIVAVPHGNGPIAAVPAGAVAELLQSATDPALFVQVHEEAAEGIAATIAFADPLPPPGAAELIEYRGRVAFAGLTGPLGAPVQAFRLPGTPQVPPPFTVTTLGVDFYHRTLVQLELTNPSGDLFEVWWADGTVPIADFGHRAVPGDASVRPAEGGKMLFDTLSLPIAKKVDRAVTIGVQAVNAADGRSEFMTVTHTLPALP